MTPLYENNILDHQSTVHHPVVCYQRIAGRLQRVESVSPDVIPPQVMKEKSSKIKQFRFYPYCIGGMFGIIVCSFFIFSIFPYPLPASCTVKWRFDEPCNHVIQRLRWQILKWSSFYNCGSQRSRCLYSLKDSGNNYSIIATHISSDFESSHNIRILFAEEIGKNCIATGASESNEWFVVFDYGSNYCNLRNLVEGANFVTNYGFRELTTDSICTQLHMVVCK